MTSDTLFRRLGLSFLNFKAGLPVFPSQGALEHWAGFYGESPWKLVANDWAQIWCLEKGAFNVEYIWWIHMQNAHGRPECHTVCTRDLDFKVQGWRCTCRYTTVSNAYSQILEERHLLVGEQLNTRSLYPVFRVHLINTMRTCLTVNRELDVNPVS